jgi:hypothetical protein
MSKDHWDTILASAPLNATAGRVVAKGVRYVAPIKIGSAEWDAPPAFTPLPSPGPMFINLIGHQHGRLRVVGYLGGGKWCCKCACGKYVLRNAKSIKNASPADRCQTCKHTAFLAREATAERIAERQKLGLVFRPRAAGEDAA